MQPRMRYRSLALTLLLPLQVTVPRDGAETAIRVGAGSGQYLDSVRTSVVGYREVGGPAGCVSARPVPIYKNDPQKAKFREAGVEVEHKPGLPGKLSGMRFGIRGHLITTDGAATNVIANPFLSIEGKTAAAGVGVVFSTQRLPGLESRMARVIPSFFFRAGLPKFHLTASFLNEIPLSSNGYFQLGMGTRLGKNIAWWVGASGMPFDSPGIATTLQVRMTPSIGLNVSGRVGTRSGQGWRISEHAASIGLSFRLRHN